MSAMDDDPLADLLVEVARQDRAALGELYRRAGPTLLALCRLICGQDELAEDTLQEAFLRIWRSAPRFDPSRGPALAWLTAITRNHAIDRLRRQSVRARSDQEPDRLLPNLHLDRALDRRDITKCLQTLRAEHRQAVLLAYFGGFGAEEIARRLGIPVGTAKSWVRRGLVQLTACLER